MSRISVELVGKKRIQQALLDARQDVRDAVEVAVVSTALDLRALVVRSIQRGPASGRMRPNGSRASAPGQPPMSDTGRLANNIYFERVGPVTAAVGSNLVYAVHLEYGTSRMAARPFFRPALEKMRIEFEDRLETAIGGALR